MTKKTPRVYTLDELNEKSRKALDDPKLVEIVKLAPLNKDGGVNCTWAYKEAEKYVHEQTKDLKKTKELAVAARFLAMLRRDFPEEFKKMIDEKPKMKTTEVTEKKDGTNFLVDTGSIILPTGVEVITWERTEIYLRYGYMKDFALRFNYGEWNNWNVLADFCLKILNDGFFGSLEKMQHSSAFTPSNALAKIRNGLIQLLEEKFGLSIKICGHCKYFKLEAQDGKCKIEPPSPRRDNGPYRRVLCGDEMSAFYTCPDWAPERNPPPHKAT